MTDETVAALAAGDGDHEHSYGEYQRRVRDGLPYCTGCRAKANEYVREWRRRNPDRIRTDRVRATVRNRALSRLAERHPEEYELLLAEEQARIADR